MSRSDSEFAQREQQQWWEDYAHDQAEMQRAQEEAMREQLMDEARAEVIGQVNKIIGIFAKRVFRAGFLFGFATAITGAVVFIYFR